MVMQHDARHWPLTCPDTQETIRSYAEYLKSKHWQRVKVLFRASPQHKGRCYICRGAEKLHLHHRTYERIGRELLTDLQELCERCHSLVHQTAEIGAASGFTIANAADMLLGDGFRGMKREAPKGRRKHKHQPKQPAPPERIGLPKPAAATQNPDEKLFVVRKHRLTAAAPYVPTRGLYHCRYCLGDFEATPRARRQVFCPNCKKERGGWDCYLVRRVK